MDTPLNSQPLPIMLPPKALPASVQSPSAPLPALRRAVIAAVAPTANNPTTCSVLLENRLPPRPGYTMPAGIGQLYAPGATIDTKGTIYAPGIVAPAGVVVRPAPGPYYNDPVTHKGGTWVLVDTNNQVVVQVLQGTSVSYPSSAALLVGTHVHTGVVDQNGNPMPQPVDLQNHTQNTIGTGQLPPAKPIAPIIYREYAPRDADPKATILAAYANLSGVLQDIDCTTWVTNVPQDKSVGRVAWAFRKSATTTTATTLTGAWSGKYWLGPVPPSGGGEPATPALAYSSGSTVNFGNYGLPGMIAPPTGFNETTAFYARFTGVFVPSVTGLWSLGTNSDDGSSISVNGTYVYQSVLNGYTANSISAFNVAGTIQLTAGVAYNIVLEYHENGSGGYACQLLGQAPGAATPSLLVASIPSKVSQWVGHWWNVASAPVGGGELATTPDAVTITSTLNYADYKTASIPGWDAAVTGPSNVATSVNPSFYARFTATFVPSISGTWNLGTNADNGSNLIVNGKYLVSDLGGDHYAGAYGTPNRGGPIDLVAGTSYDLVVEWAEKTDPYALQFLAQSPVDAAYSPLVLTNAGQQAALPWVYYAETDLPGLPAPTPLEQIQFAYGDVFAGSAYDFGVAYVNTGGVIGPITPFARNYSAQDIRIANHYLINGKQFTPIVSPGIPSPPAPVALAPTQVLANPNGLVSSVQVAFQFLNQPRDGSLSRVSLWHRNSNFSTGFQSAGSDPSISASVDGWSYYGSLPAVGIGNQPINLQALGNYVFVYTDISNGVTYDFGMSAEDTQGGETPIVLITSVTQPTPTSPPGLANGSANLVPDSDFAAGAPYHTGSGGFKTTQISGSDPLWHFNGLNGGATVLSQEGGGIMEQDIADSGRLFEAYSSPIYLKPGTLYTLTVDFDIANQIVQGSGAGGGPYCALVDSTGSASHTTFYAKSDHGTGKRTCSFTTPAGTSTLKVSAMISNDACSIATGGYFRGKYPMLSEGSQTAYVKGPATPAGLSTTTQSIAIAPAGATPATVAASPTLTSGAGVPATTAPAGSTYIRTDALTAATSTYVNPTGTVGGWVPSSTQSLGDLINVSAPAPTDGQALVYNTAQAKWVPGTTLSSSTGGTSSSTGGASVTLSGLQSTTGDMLLDQSGAPLEEANKPATGLVLGGLYFTLSTRKFSVWAGTSLGWIDQL